MKQITIEISDETYNRMLKLASIVDFLTKDDDGLSPEDIVYAALSFYLERFYPNFILPHNPDQLFSLSLDYPLKNRIKSIFEDVDLSLSTISKQTQIPKTTLSNIFNNNNQPTMDIFLKLYPLMGYPKLHEAFYRELPE